jgi:hypothetical protein
MGTSVSRRAHALLKMRTMKRILVTLCVAAAACSSSAANHVASPLGSVDPTSGWSGCSGTFDTSPSPTGAYFITDFGCSSSPSYTDTGDNCCPDGVAQAASAGLCASGTTTAGCTSTKGTPAAVACERAVNWFSTGGSAYGLGTHLRLTRPDTGTSVVVFVIDNGPACFREKEFGGYALDISYPAIMALYGSEEGVSDRATVTATVVPSSTPLGPSSGTESDAGGSGSSTPDSGGGGGSGGGGSSGSKDSGGGSSSATNDSGPSSSGDSGGESASEDSDSGGGSSDSDGGSASEDSSTSEDASEDSGGSEDSGSEDAAPLGEPKERDTWGRLVTWS